MALLPVVAVTNAVIPWLAAMPLLMVVSSLSSQALPRLGFLILAFLMQVLLTLGGGWVMAAIGTIVPDARRALGPMLDARRESSPRRLCS